MVLEKLNKFSSDLYLDLLVAKNYPEQEPAHKNAKWYDLFWLLIPIVGFLGFIITIENR